MSRLYNNPSVHMKNPELVEKKLKQMAVDGLDRLMIISDFDFTLSRHKDKNGEKCWSTHGVFDAVARVMNPELKQMFDELYKKYFSIEFCPLMTVEEKIPYMIEWWDQSHAHIVNAKFSRETIEGFTSNSRIFLRERAEELIGALSEHEIPLIVFSAGIGNIIETVMRNQLGAIPETMHIISNLMIFDDQDICADFTKPLIHTFNKNSSVITGDQPFYNQIVGRTNVILMGDSLGDIHMDVGVEHEGVALKIGFLNINFDTLLAKYLDSYDIVLVDDQTMEIPINILDHLRNSAFIGSRLSLTCHEEAEKEDVVGVELEEEEEKAAAEVMA
uniref:5'-nucleotidase n=1 Tax=Acrobeloides nanus TaxID=290746 RepID=A0A914DIF7_9BILA